MKIKFILFLFFQFIFFNSISYSNEFEIVSDNIKILDNGKIIESIQTNAIIKSKGLYIEGDYSIYNKEKEVIKVIHEFPSVIKSSYKELSPALIANYLYDLVKSFNSLYQNHHILNSESKDSTSMRLTISSKTANIIESCCDLLGIELPNKM